MKFQVENLSVDFGFENEEFLGYTTLVIPKKILLGFLEHHDIDYDLEDGHVDDAIPYDPDGVAYWFEDQEEVFRSTNADFHILLYEYIIEYSGEDLVEVEYYGSNPFWIFHDICHSRNDITGSEIYVDQYIEEERIYDGIKLAQENGMGYCIGVELLQKCDEGLYERWKHNLDMDKAINLLNQVV